MNPDLARLLESLSKRGGIPHAERILPCIEEARDLTSHNEEGVAFENLCQNLFEWGYPLTKEDYADIERLGHHYGFGGATWNFLAKIAVHPTSADR